MLLLFLPSANSAFIRSRPDNSHILYPLDHSPDNRYAKEYKAYYKSLPPHDLSYNPPRNLF